MASATGRRTLIGILATTLLLSLGEVSSTTCPSGWVQRPDTYDCYYFRTITASWDQARAYCGSYEGDLVTVEKAGENQWLLSQMTSNQDYWIGLSDPDGLMVYAWSDGSIYDPSTASWAPGQPSHGKGSRVCVKMSISDRGMWTDSDCGQSKAFICQKSLTSPILCDETNGWQSYSGSCYYTSTRWSSWDDAQDYCQLYDSNLMDIQDAAEQQFLSGLVHDATNSLWIGYKTTTGKTNFQWSSGAAWNYQHWATNEPKNDTEMCALVQYEVTSSGDWTAENCFMSRRFICEKVQGMCYPGWKMHSGYCYQLAAYQPTTWIDAKQMCDQQGAILLTVKSETEQEFVNQQLPSLSQSGIENIWLGVSDTLEDGKIQWADGQDLLEGDYANWPAHKTPANRPDENQCGSIYTESSIGQWDYGDCINIFNYVCKIKEGAAIKPVNPDLPSGYCPADWYLYNNYCYYINNTGITFADAEQTCNSNGGNLASIHSAAEMSFIELRLGSRDYYIGLNDRAQEGEYKWTDGSDFDYRNWDLGEPNNHGNSEDCVHVRGPYTTPAGVWNDIYCDAEYSFICKRPAAATTPPPPTNPPTLDCYEPYQPYYDKAQLTVDGDVCLYWKDMTGREFNPISYPDARLDENYCRNPNNGPAPWCYVEFGLKECDIPQCNAPQDCYEGDGYLYRGKSSQTENGDDCLAWASLDSRAYYRPDTFPEEGLEGKYCRNPSGATYGPWCYYNLSSSGYYQLASCGIQQCNTSGCYEGSGRNYRGSAHETESGMQCEMWDEASSMPYNPTTYPNSGLDHNYCRNPSQDDKPWCYVQVDLKLVQESCAVPHCASEVGCTVGRGLSYRGLANYVSIGRTCLDWVDFIDEFYPVALNEFAVTYFHSIQSVHEHFSGLTQEQCAWQCLHDSSHFCKSFNFYPGTLGTANSLCTLSQFSREDGSLIPDGQQDYYERNQTYGLEDNYCRNPNGAAAPWCYYFDPLHNSTFWAFCDVPECNPEDVGCYNPLDDGDSYRGPARTTASGHTCEEWVNTFYTPDRYPNAGLEENFCRNPSSFNYAPFCMYHGTHGLTSEYCDIPQCNIVDVCEGDDWTTDPSEEWCYKISTGSSLSFDEALDQCEKEDSSLTSITSESESSFLVGLISDLSVTGLWIGATDLYQEGGWEWTDGSPFAFLKWMAGQPDNLHGTEQCALMSGNNGQWTDENCDLTFPHICKKQSTKPRTTVAPTTQAPGTRCPTDWAGFGSHCYLVQQDLVDWKTARSACEALDASLASVHSEGEMKHIASMLTQASRQYYFFGANDIHRQDDWVYGNGTVTTPVSYTKWADGEPNNFGAGGENCAAMLYSWGWEWNDANCDTKYQVVCENENNEGDMKVGRYTAHWGSMTFKEAQAHCVNYDGSMATIRNDEDRDTMKRLLDAFYDPFYPDIFWIGANDINKEGSWMMGGDPDSSTTLTYTNWHAGEPNNYRSDGEHCGLLAPFDESDPDDPTFEWYDWACGNAERFICEDIDPKSDYIGMNGHPYTAVNEALLWQEASTYCKSNGGNLAQIRSESDQYTINYMLSDNRKKLLSSKGAWLGLNDISHQMTFEWTDGSEVTYINWNTGEPDDFAKAQDCVFSYSRTGQDSTGRRYYAGKWADYECSAEDFGYVCMKGPGNFGPSEIPPPEYDCPLGWTGSDVYCYLILDTQLSWSEARDECANNMDHGKPTNTTIVYIPDYQEQDILQNILLDKTGLYWIGLHDADREGRYKWEGGQPVTFTQWDTNQPGNEQHPCVAMSAGTEKAGQWDDQSCDSRYSTICQKPRHEGYAPELPATPSPTGTCPSGWVGFESYCYLIVRQTDENDRADFYSANSDCFYRTSDFSGHLASLHSHHEERFIMDQVKSISPSVDADEGFWIGMSAWGDGYMYWVDGSPVQYVNWAPDMPTSRPTDDISGLVMYPGDDDQSADSGWEFISTQSKRSWICKSARGSQSVTTLAPVSPGRSQKCSDGADWARWDYNSALDTCYLFKGSDEPNRIMWTNALAGCDAEGGSLVSIHSATENNFVQGLAQMYSVNKIWIGMYDVETRGGFTWSDNSPAEYFNWDVNEPGSSVTSCVSMDTTTSGWKLAECDDQVSYMCKKTPGVDNYTPAPTERAGGFCPRDWFTWGNKCLQFQDNQDTWPNARNQCQTLGGDLASIRDKTEEAYIVTLLEGVPDAVWIGLNDRSHEGLFTWSDGSKVYFTNWDTNEPNNYENDENCVHMYGSGAGSIPGTWNDAECTQRYRALCQIPRDPNGTPAAPTLSLCGSYRHYANSCYKLYNGSFTRNRAMEMCASDGLDTTLASINSLYEQREIQLMLREADITTPMYIGLTYANHTYRWDDGWPVTYTNWDHGQPSLGALEQCTSFHHGSGRWDDVMCNSTYGAICKYTFDTKPVQPTLSPEDCPDSDWSVHGGACYKAFLEEENYLPWAAAEYVCSEDQAHLVSIHNTEERDFVRSLVTGDIYSVWIGLRNIHNSGYQWEDGSPIEYVNWAPGEPSGKDGDQQDEECIQMYTTGGFAGQWNDLYCVDPWPFVCKYTQAGSRPGTTSQSEPRTDSGLGVGVIVGITVGAAAFIVLIIILFAMLRRQSRMVAYFRSVAGLEVAHDELFNDDSNRGSSGRSDGGRAVGGRTDSFDDAMLTIN